MKRRIECGCVINHIASVCEKEVQGGIFTRWWCGKYNINPLSKNSVRLSLLKSPPMKIELWGNCDMIRVTD